MPGQYGFSDGFWTNIYALSAASKVPVADLKRACDMADMDPAHIWSQDLPALLLALGKLKGTDEKLCIAATVEFAKATDFDKIRAQNRAQARRLVKAEREIRRRLKH